MERAISKRKITDQSRMRQPGIVDRKSVDTPLETGILSIDSMFPIGRGHARAYHR